LELKAKLAGRKVNTRTTALQIRYDQTLKYCILMSLVETVQNRI
jgi:hypothetical protein